MKPEIRKRINILLMVTFIFGIALSMQIKNLSDKTSLVNIEGVNEMEMQLKIENAEIGKLEEYLARKTSELEDYSTITDSPDLNSVMEAKLSYYRNIQGENDLTGKGVIIEIRDSDKLVKYMEYVMVRNGSEWRLQSVRTPILPETPSLGG